ncbi:nucleotidyltransferase family protein [Mucilaginibacter sp. UR6-1]|uniref:nucleotidyltransferase family protein n=1 Tax=Mucilaginibacter sp. UR6-1 TaxID=1435643 RepID=UPI001E55B320|nr:nucleotidyltransferase family protein [Mucilaginibacter sp. UR6-1]MCC8409452.1 nucleotidyltransferase family protein [Mucilaginibacter sp. UR6-1]
MLSIVILAAGASSRLGRAKQNLIVKDLTLLQQAVINAQQVSHNVVVVLGADHEAIAGTIDHLEPTILHNAEWVEGIASSVRKAICQLSDDLKLRAVLFMVCDQPFANAGFLQLMVDTAKASDRNIIASGYGHTIGVPILFKRAYFDHLKNLKGDEGAKKIAITHPDDLLVIPFPEGVIDIDTEQDYQAFKKYGD